MVSTNIMLPTDFLALSERTTLRASIEFDYESLDLRGGDLVEELMRGVAHSFGLDRLPDYGERRRRSLRHPFLVDRPCWPV
jgi:hypothetical protein